MLYCALLPFAASIGRFIAGFVASATGTEIGMVNRGGIKNGFSLGAVTFGTVVSKQASESVKDPTNDPAIHTAI